MTIRALHLCIKVWQIKKTCLPSYIPIEIDKKKLKWRRRHLYQSWKTAKVVTNTCQKLLWLLLLGKYKIRKLTQEEVRNINKIKDTIIKIPSMNCQIIKDIWPGRFYTSSRSKKFWTSLVAVVRNPPANAGDTGSSPGPGRYHMPQRNWAHAPQLLSLWATTTEARVPRARAPQQEKPPQWEARTPQQRVAPARCN